MDPATTETVTLYSANVCPFAHRTRLVLAEKGVEVELVEIDLRNKPADFERVSPYGKVPVVVRGADRVWESAVINEYLDEVYPQPALMPASAGSRAQARIWIDFTNSRLVPAFYKVLMDLDASGEQWREALGDSLRALEGAMRHYGGESGPWFFGEQLTLVDLTLYPWFERWPILEHYRDFAVPGELTRLARWRDALARRDSVRSLANAPQLYIEQYVHYAHNAASTDTARELRGGPQRAPRGF